MIDLDTHRPIDVLPDREASTLAAWLREHPGIEVICRDRAGAYADGARTGAPQAIQVADRWHLWHNLAKAIEKTVIRHRADLPEPSPAGDDDSAGQDVVLADPCSQSIKERPETPVMQRTRDRYAAIQQLRMDGKSISAISCILRLDRHTVRRFANADGVDELLAKSRSRNTVLDTFRPYLHQRFNDGHTDGAALYREIREQGYRGSSQTVRHYLQPFRDTGTAPPARPADPKIRDVTRWILTRPDDLDPQHQQSLDQILQRSPNLTAAARHVRAFAGMMGDLAGHRLPEWIRAVMSDDLPALHSFVTGVRRDLDAVTAGLTLPYSSGAVEGHVQRIKTIKRQMYGRAKFDLLRRRILHS